MNSDRSSGEEWPQIEQAGDQGMFVRFGDSISPGIHACIRTCLRKIDHHRPEWVVDCIPGYCALLLIYQPLQVDPHEVRGWLKQLLRDLAPDQTPGRVVEVPVWYDAEVGPDLGELARSKALSVAEVIRIHCAPEYLVYMLGFKPGFPFLGGLDERLWSPRLDTPRLEVPAGSVGVGGRQTGIYPVKSPGGWRIIGRTPWKIFSLNREHPFRILPGERVKFTPIEREQFRQLEERA